MLKHCQKSTYNNSPVIEFHDHPDCDPEFANQFSRFSFGGSKATKICKAMAANGVEAVVEELVSMCNGKLTDDERKAIRTSFAKAPSKKSK